MAAELTCPVCGEPRDHGALEGLCAKCLARGLVVDSMPEGVTAVVGEEPQFAPVIEGPGTIIGRYKLLQRLGEGGFGVVFMAEQREPIVRRVALKVLKQGMDTRQVIARFEAERQALAMMDHPAIAKVFDAGATATGRPYFVMELVRGLPITRFCDEQDLNLRQRLELFTEVCSAVQHAHQKGIIHRDLKPSNILVGLEGDRPVSKVIDFGIAKATQLQLTEKTLFTHFEQFLGTPLYVSPEQVGLHAVDIDTRSDIYSLGVVLYELLIGNPPLDAQEIIASGFDEMRRIIREKEAPKPSTRLSTLGSERLTTVAKHRGVEPGKLGLLLRGDLDWIVMKAIEKDRTRRYETATGFALDIQRYLKDEPVSATPPGVGYQFRKFARRNKTELRVAAAIAAVLVAATAVSTWQAVRAVNAEKKTAASLEQVIHERDAKERARRDAEALSAFLAGLLQSPDPAREGRKVTVAEMLDKAARGLEVAHDTPPADQARLQATLAQTYFGLGLVREAIPLQEKARDYYLTTFGPESSELLNANLNVARLYDSDGRREEAHELYLEVFSLSRKLFGEKDRLTLRSMGALAGSHHDLGRWEEALKLNEQTLELSRKWLGPEDSDTFNAMSNLAISYGEVPSRRKETLQLREQVLEVSLKLKGPKNPETVGVMHNLAVFHLESGNHDEAIKRFEEVLKLSREVKGDKHLDTLVSTCLLVTSYNRAGRWKEGIELGEQALAIHREELDPNHPSTLEMMIALGDAYRGGKQLGKAIELFEQVLKFRRDTKRPEDFETLGAMTNLALLYGDDGRVKEAIALQEEALKLKRRVLPETHAWLPIAIHNLARLYEMDGRRKEALDLRKELLELRFQELGPKSTETLTAMDELAAAYHEAGFPDESRRLDEEMLRVRRDAFGPMDPGAIAALTNLAISYAEAGDLKKAIELQEESLKLMRQMVPKNKIMLEYALENMAGLYEKNKEGEKAKELAAELKALKAGK